MDIPENIGRKLYPASHFIGYRLPEKDPSRTLVLASIRDRPWGKKMENIIQSVVGAFVGLILLGAISKSSTWRGHNVPTIVASFGAEAVLLYAGPTSPMAQPRNIVISMFLSSLIAVAMAKGFANLVPPGAFPTEYKIDFIAGATAVAVTLFVTQLLSVPHPPGGATALLACTNTQVYHLSWVYVAYIMVGSFTMLAWALIINNLGHRRYPQYWISPDLVPTETNKAKKETLLTAPGSAEPGEKQA